MDLDDRDRKFLQEMFVKERNRLLFKGFSVYTSAEGLLSIIKCLCFKGVMAPASVHNLEIKDLQILSSLSSLNLIRNKFIQGY